MRAPNVLWNLKFGRPGLGLGVGGLNGTILLAAPECLVKFEIWLAGTGAGSGRPERYDFAQDCGWEWEA